MWMTTLVNGPMWCGCIDYLASMTDLLLENWSVLVLALISMLSTYTALTETEKDDKALDVIKRIVQAIVLGKSRRK